MLLGTLLIVILGCDQLPSGTPLSATPSQRGPSQGPLVVLPENPRYFTAAGRPGAVYLTGSHTWNNFQDWGLTDPPPRLNYAAYLDFLEHHGHNFIRLYVWEQAAWFPGTEAKVVIAPLPYPRTGPGQALDGGLRFDLEQLNPEYFRRLRERVEAAGARGIYVSVMLFDGWSIELKGQQVGNPWRGHPFNSANNINGIDGDVDRDGQGKEVHTLVNPTVTRLQKVYLRKVVETLGDLDNVLWEISNESHPEAGSVEWQYEMIHTIKTLESTRTKRHPVGMTSLWPEPADRNLRLFSSPADWISPHDNSSDPYRNHPPPSTGRKVILSDTDHLWGVGGHRRWVWMSFLRGLNPIFMDPYLTAIRNNLPAWPSSEATNGGLLPAPRPEWDDVRKAMGDARALAERVDLASMRPMGELASTGYCLADPGREYLVFLPASRPHKRLLGLILMWRLNDRVDVDLSAARGPLDVEWVDAELARIVAGDSVTGGQRLTFYAPFWRDAILHLKSPTRRDAAVGPWR